MRDDYKSLEQILDNKEHSSKYLLLHGTVVTVDSERRIIEDGGILIENDRIKQIGTSESLLKEYGDDINITKINLKRKMLVPGLIDVHAHAGHSLLTLLGEATMSNWMPMMTEIYHYNTTDEFWYREGRLAALTRLSYGITTGLSVISNCQRTDRLEVITEHARAYGEMGMRGIVAIGPSGPPYPRTTRHILEDGSEFHGTHSLDDLLRNTEDFIKVVNHTYEDRIRAFVAPFVLIPSFNQSSPTPADVGIELTELDRYMMKSIREIAKNCNTRIHTEAFGGMIRVAAQAPEEYMLLGPDVHLQHCTGISLDEAKILADTGTHISSTPSDRQMYNRCPVPELMMLGANVVVASDGTAPYNSFDLIRGTQNMALVHRGFLVDRFYLPEGKLLEMITIDAAKAIGMEDEIGSLEVGKKADIAIVDLDMPHLSPNLMPLRKWLTLGNAADVHSVMVDGRFIYINGQSTLAIRREILDQAELEARTTISRAGMEKFFEPVDTFWGSYRKIIKTKRFEDKGWK